MNDITQQLSLRVSEQLPGILDQLRQAGFDPELQQLQLECSLTLNNAGPHTPANRVQVAAVDIGRDFTPSPNLIAPPQGTGFSERLLASLPLHENATRPTSTWAGRTEPSPNDNNSTNTRRRKLSIEDGTGAVTSEDGVTSMISNTGGPRKKRPPENPNMQPSSFDKVVAGIWDSIFSGIRMDPIEIIEQWQAIESGGQPRLLENPEQQITVRNDTGDFGRMNMLMRRINQTNKACKSLQIIVQTSWVQCFEDRVSELGKKDISTEKAKGTAIAEACTDFNWTEKDLRNKMAIWRGYHEIKNTGGWVALVFAGAGLYRFCKYRVSFGEETTFNTLRRLRHRFEVAADTLHPRWRSLLAIVGEPTEPKYHGHPHDWVVLGPGDGAIPLPQTYHQWDRDFSYTHLCDSVLHQGAWGDFDPRTVDCSPEPGKYKCQTCNETQSDSPVQNRCFCYPNMYGSPKAGMQPVQIFRTPNGKNNGLIACCPFENGWAVGEFLGLITSGLEGMDVMIGETEHTTYQIWQGRQGNHTRFVNHSCQPNSHFERFVWLGKQRIVLASKGVQAGEEITVDYGHTYWDNLDKECKCDQLGCRYRDRNRTHLLTPPNENDDE